MAEAFADYLGKGSIQAERAGSRPSGMVNPDPVQIMKEKGIDLSQKISKSVQDLSGAPYDYVVTMGCEEACPVVPIEGALAWDIPDPKGKDLSVFREVRDLIGGKVKALLEEIKSSQGS